MYSVTRASLALVLLCYFVALAQESAEIAELAGQPKRCSYDHVFNYYGAYCANLGLNKVPSLKTTIEILDLSDNKLRDLTNNCFADYTSLRMLYLADNKIYAIEEKAFAPLTYLQSLDLSRNVITSIPTFIFQLPSLKKLYLSGNPLNQMSSTYSLSKPIRAPIEFLDISDCQLHEIWNWGIVPQLLFYNISHNSFSHLEVSHFVEMCSLRKVDLTKALDNINLCDLKAPIKWLQRRRVDYLLLDDFHAKLKSREFSMCSDLTISDDLNATYASCVSAYRVPVPESHPSRNTWARLCGGLAGFLVGFMLLLYVFHRYNVAKTTRAEKKHHPPIQGDKRASELLLNETSA